MVQLARARARFGRKCASLAGAAACALGATAANAATIKTTFDSSVTSRSNGAQIMAAFNNAAKTLGSALSNVATINVHVSWGKVNGASLGAGSLGTTVANMYGKFSYAQVKGWIAGAAATATGNKALATAAKSLPASLTNGPTQFAIASAQAKALGLIPSNQLGMDAYLGFSSSALFDFDPSNGINANAYNFQAVATHELSHALGRLTGIASASPTWITPLDLFRYTAPGKRTTSYTAASYLSLDGGVTRLGDLNNSAGWDRSDWLSSTTGLGDVQAAAGKPGQSAAFSGADVSVLQALGWGSTIAPNGSLLSPTQAAYSYMGSAAPEPASWALMLMGTGLLGGMLRLQRSRARIPA